MNCPMHIRIYASDPHSYRDLPVRLAEFGTVYRWEKSGELGGMTRVRGFTQDDGHVFCTEDQLQQELLGCLELVKIILGTLNMTDFRVRVGLRDPAAKYVGKPRVDPAAMPLHKGGESWRAVFPGPGEAAFYDRSRLLRARRERPRVAARDRAGRFQLPRRFDLPTPGADNHPPGGIIPRAPFVAGRFSAVIAFGGVPLWLGPSSAVSRSRAVQRLRNDVVMR